MIQLTHRSGIVADAYLPFICSSSNPGKHCSNIPFQLCSQYHNHVLNFNHVFALILDLAAAWLQMLSRIMSLCQSLRFICVDLMGQLQTLVT